MLHVESCQVIEVSSRKGREDSFLIIVCLSLAARGEPELSKASRGNLIISVSLNVSSTTSLRQKLRLLLSPIQLVLWVGKMMADRCLKGNGPVFWMRS